MTSSEDTGRLSARRKALFYAIYLLILAALFVAGSEAILRSRGVQPWRKFDIPIRVEPGGKLYQKHPTLGYTHIPGRFTVTLPTGYSFRVTHLPDTLRVTRPIESSRKPKEKGEIWIFGCSFTHGWTVDDEETYPWLLQERFPEHDVTNFGVGGYGTIHSLIQFREALEGKTPRVAVLTYAGFHPARNTFSRVRRKAVAPWNKLGPLVQPYARLDGNSELNYFVADVEYREFPMMSRLALAHFLEMEYNKLELRNHRGQDVSKALVYEMAKLAKERGVKLVFADIGGGRGVSDYVQRNGIPTVDISVDLRRPENTNRPHDGHPSPLAHQKYADKLGDFLSAELDIK